MSERLRSQDKAVARAVPTDCWVSTGSVVDATDLDHRLVRRVLKRLARSGVVESRLVDTLVDVATGRFEGRAKRRLRSLYWKRRPSDVVETDAAIEAFEQERARWRSARIQRALDACLAVLRD